VIGDILQPTHLLFILVVALIVLGPKRLPEVGRSLGKGLRDFRAALGGEELDHPEEIVAPTPVAPTAVAPAAIVPTGVVPTAVAQTAIVPTVVEQPHKPAEHAG
jgi:sec-independent protein translocase protein TatA